MFCNHCGAENADGSHFCAACGLAITSPSVRAAPADSLDGAQTELGLTKGMILNNRYRIVKELGLGGMGRVYLAEDQKLEIQVAIKVLRDVLSRDPGSIKRLIAEAKHSIALSHPNVVRVHNFEDSETAKFLIMEYVEGETLAHRISREEKIPERASRRIAIEICKGLEHAHQKKVIHRDIKPGNILLGKNGEIKLADFGIARECRDSMSHLTSQADSGTLLYMSPEQLLGKSNEASDIYSLGVVLYEMLAGEPPFRSGDVTYQIREVTPETPADISPAMSAIVIKCLEKKPENRFSSAHELIEELDGTAGRRQIDARHRIEEEKKLRAQEAARQREEEQRQKRVTGNTINMEFVAIPAGKFMMGCSPGDSECYDDENPRHEVTITKSFQMGKYEVTQDQWSRIMGSNPSHFKGDGRLPVENISWNDAQKFIDKLNGLNDGYRYRLPTEAEWEYAARAGITGPYYGNLDSIGWYSDNSGSKTHPVGQKQANGFGLYDMIGNVWEWCSDWYGEGYYGGSPSADPKGPSSGQYRTLRGGSWNDVARFTRVSVRYRFLAAFRNNFIGVRLCRERF